jgi:hypothetical protein
MNKLTLFLILTIFNLLYLVLGLVILYTIRVFLEDIIDELILRILQQELLHHYVNDILLLQLGILILHHMVFF